MSLIVSNGFTVKNIIRAKVFVVYVEHVDYDDKENAHGKKRTFLCATQNIIFVERLETKE
jgi:hypothetical protein